MVVGIAAFAVILITILMLVTYGPEGVDSPATVTDAEQGSDQADTAANQNQTRVVMPIKSSRPGCELEMLCYIPHTMRVLVDQKIVWENQDVAFHSVTSGVYGSEPRLFDSGHMDPGDEFGYAFEEPGRYVYHCTLHPWMDGVVEVIER